MKKKISERRYCDNTLSINESTKKPKCPRCKKVLKVTMSEGAAIAVLQYAGWNVKLRRPGHAIEAKPVKSITVTTIKSGLPKVKS